MNSLRSFLSMAAPLVMLLSAPESQAASIIEIIIVPAVGVGFDNLNMVLFLLAGTVNRWS